MLEETLLLEPDPPPDPALRVRWSRRRQAREDAGEPPTLVNVRFV